MTYCGENTAVKDEPGSITAVTLRCRSWLCPHCMDQRKRQLIAEAIGGRPNTFLTLTSRRSEATTAEQAAASLTHAWRVLRKRCIREAQRDVNKNPIPFGASREGPEFIGPPRPRNRQVNLRNNRLPFLAVVEKTELGWPHLHILLRSNWLEAAWLSAQMRNLIDSPVLKIKRLDQASRAAVYCAKYCSKASHKFHSTKRYWKSRDYEQRAARKPDDLARSTTPWERRSATLRFLVGTWLRQGHRVTFLSDCRVEVQKRKSPIGARGPDG